MANTKKYLIIKEAIDQFDPLGLLAQGAPEDEYDIEAKIIESELNSSDKPLEEVIKDVFEAQFGEPLNNALAADIAALIRKNIKKQCC